MLSAALNVYGQVLLASRPLTLDHWLLLTLVMTRIAPKLLLLSLCCIHHLFSAVLTAYVPVTLRTILTAFSQVKKSDSTTGFGHRIVECVSIAVKTSWPLKITGLPLRAGLGVQGEDGILLGKGRLSVLAKQPIVLEQILLISSRVTQQKKANSTT